MDDEIIYIKIGSDRNWHAIPGKITSRESDGSVQAVYFNEYDEPLADEFIKDSNDKFWKFKTMEVDQPYVRYSPHLSQAASELRAYIRSQDRKI